MSNDKAAAAAHGPLTVCCWMGKHSGGEDHVRMCANYQTTGEHVQAKLSDYTYGQAAQESMAFQLSQAVQHTGGAVPGVPTSDERRYAKPAHRVRRHWTPTKREIQISAVLFFVLVAVSGWVFRALG